MADRGGLAWCSLLRKKIARGLSAGRVVCRVRLIAEREREIKAFVPGRVLAADPRTAV